MRKVILYREDRVATCREVRGRSRRQIKIEMYKRSPPPENRFRRRNEMRQRQRAAACARQVSGRHRAGSSSMMHFVNQTPSRIAYLLTETIADIEYFLFTFTGLSLHT